MILSKYWCCALKRLGTTALDVSELMSKKKKIFKQEHSFDISLAESLSTCCAPLAPLPISDCLQNFYLGPALY